MDRAKARELLLETERQRLSLRLLKKVRKLSMLRKRKQTLLNKKVAMEKLVDDLMPNFIGPVENTHLENAQNFDAKAMMDPIATIMNSNIGLDFEEKAISDAMVAIVNCSVDAIVAMVNSLGSGRDDNGGFPDSHGGINNEPKSDKNLGTLKGTNCDSTDSCGGGNSSHSAGEGSTSVGSQHEYCGDGSL